jgi:uncharacterized damage-inducible protein DinB
MFDLDEFLHYFQRVRERTRRVAACIPAEQVDWTYKEGAFTLGDLVRHIAVTERFIWAETVHNRPAAYVTHGRELADGRDAILAFFDRLHEESLAQFRALTPAMLEGKCVTPAGTPLTTWKWLRMLPEHEIHHRGQLYTMLAMLKVPTPPLYGLTSDDVRKKSSFYLPGQDPGIG